MKRVSKAIDRLKEDLFEVWTDRIYEELQTLEEQNEKEFSGICKYFKGISESLMWQIFEEGVLSEGNIYKLPSLLEKDVTDLVDTLKGEFLFKKEEGLKIGRAH